MARLRDIYICNLPQHFRFFSETKHIITNNLSDEADMEDKMRGLYARSNMLRRKFYFWSDQVKNKLFSTYCNNIYIYMFAMGLLSKEMHAPVYCIL